jgi:hypothetical protein
MLKLLAYVLMAMNAWVVVPGKKQQDTTHFDKLANEIVAVCGDPNEKPLFKGDDDRHRSCIYFAAQAFEESHLWKHVYEGHCSRLTGGDCDANNAFGPWQIHDRRDFSDNHGVDLQDDGWLYTHGKGGKTGPDFVKDPAWGARFAYHMLRKTPGAWTTNAHARGRAVQWVATHPFE